MLLFQHHSPLPAWQHRIKYASTSTCARNQTCKYQNVLNQLEFASPPTAVDCSVWSKSLFLVPVWGKTAQRWHLNTPNQLTHCHLLQRSTLFFQSQVKPTILRWKSRERWRKNSPYKMRWSIWKRRNGRLRLNDMTKKTMVTFRSCGMRYQIEITWVLQIYISIPSEGSLAESR